MPEHYPRNTESATAWCKKCGRSTDHRVDGGRLGPCMPCMERGRVSGIPHAVIPPLDLPKKPEQGDLFGEREAPGNRRSRGEIEEKK